MIRYSASQLQNYDDEDPDGCPRRWYFKSIAKIPEPQRAGAELGTQTHLVLERHFGAGVEIPTKTKPGKIAASGLHLLPDPGAYKFQVEKKFRLRLFGVEFVGLIDMCWFDEHASLHVLDHKTSKNPEQYGLSSEDLLTNIQAILYAKASIAEFKLDEVDLHWIYYATQGKRRAFESSARLVTRDVDNGLVKVERLVEKMNRDRTCKQANDVTPNFGACGAYGGCHYGKIGVCERSPMQRLASGFQKAGQEMGLKDKIKKKPGLNPAKARKAYDEEEKQAPKKKGSKKKAAKKGSSKKEKPPLRERAKARGLNAPEGDELTEQQELELSKKSLKVKGKPADKKAKVQDMVDETLTTGEVPDVPEEEPKKKKGSKKKANSKKSAAGSREEFKALVSEAIAAGMTSSDAIDHAASVLDAISQRYA